MNLRWQRAQAELACSRKRYFFSEREARAAPGARLPRCRVFNCPVCHGWHIGRTWTLNAPLTGADRTEE